MGGWTALIFHPDALYSTTQLRNLDLTIYRFDHLFSVVGDRHIIPPVEELDRSFGQIETAAGDNIPTAGIVLPQWT